MLDEAQRQKLEVVVNTAAFALAFSAWIMLGPSARVLGAELGLTAAQVLMLKTLPVLTGAALRIPVGILADRVGARVMFPLLLLVGAGASLWLSFAASHWALLGGGLALGLVGTTFAVGTQAVSSWTPPARQGFALGIFGAGNVGTALTTFGMPLLLVAVGWRDTFRVYALVGAAAAVAYALLHRDAPRRGPRPTFAVLARPLLSARAWVLGFHYVATFGVFVAITTFINDFYLDVHRVSPALSAVLATTFTFSSSLARIPGGWIADRIGATRTLALAAPVAAAGLAQLCAEPSLGPTVAAVFAMGLALGVGMAATLKHVPEEFPGNVGPVGGIVGAVGGLGGFFLPVVGGWLVHATGAASLRFAPLFLAVAISLVVAVRADRARALVPAQQPA